MKRLEASRRRPAADTPRPCSPSRAQYAIFRILFSESRMPSPESLAPEPNRRLPAVDGCLLGCRSGDLVWSAVVLVAVLLPLASLTLDVPRYFVLRSRLQLAADAAAEAGAQCVDLAHFQETGEAVLEAGCLGQEPAAVFAATVAPLQAKGYQLAMGVQAGSDTVQVQAWGRLPIFFQLTPALTVRVRATSRFRMESR